MRTISPSEATNFAWCQKYLNECFEYERKTGNLIWKHRPQTHFKSSRAWKRFLTTHAGKVAGHPNGNGYIRILLDGHLFYAHRVIWKMIYDTTPDLIDHKDQTRSNNRLHNLRIASHQQNLWNSKAHKDNQLGVKGVRRVKKTGKYTASIYVEGKHVHLGTFTTIDLAKEAYDLAANQVHTQYEVVI